MNYFKDIVEQHFEEAAFLWTLRANVAKKSSFTQVELAKLESRIDHNLMGLILSFDEAWQLCLDAIGIQKDSAGEQRSIDPGCIFVAAVIAFQLGITDREGENSGRVRTVLNIAKNEVLVKAVVSALAWIPAKIGHTWIKTLLDSNNQKYQYLAICACSAKRVHPGDSLSKILQNEDNITDTALYSRALRLVGELKIRDYYPLLKKTISRYGSCSEFVFWAQWSQAFIGERHQLDSIKKNIFVSGKLQEYAINVAFRILPNKEAKQYVTLLLQEENNQDANDLRTALQAITALGDLAAVPWLIDKMDDPAISRYAGLSFTLLTGVDLEQHQLIDIERGQKSRLRETFGTEPDDELPWPDSKKVNSLWQHHRNGFSYGDRYFLGDKISEEKLNYHLTNGTQLKRAPAAIELALLHPRAPYINICEKCQPLANEQVA